MILDSPIISGSSTVTGNLTVLGTLTASVSGSATSASYATNAETLDGLDSTSFTTTSSFNTASGSFSTRVTNLESFSSSLDATFATDAQLTAVSQSFSSSLSTVSSSFSTRVSSLETASGSFSTRVTNAESSIASLNSRTGSFATTGSNIFNGTQTITGSLFITENLTVLGSSSISYISQSTLNIGTNLITVNAQNPSIRFGGIAVIDSGSSPQVSGSWLFDSIQDRWIMLHQQTAGSALTSSIAIMGPETYNNLGNETTIALNRLVKGSSGASGEHIGNSNISDTGTVVSINSATQITGSLVTNSTASFAGNVGIGTTSPSERLVVANTTGTVLDVQATSTGGDTRLRLNPVNNNNYSLYVNGSTDALQFMRNSSELMRITSIGNVLIGSTTSLYTDTNRGVLEVNGASSAIVGLTIGGTNGGYLLHNGTDLSIWNAKNGAAIFGTNNTERMRVTGAGNVGIGTTTPNSTLQVSRGGVTFQVTDTNKTSINTFSIYGLTQTSWAIATGNSGSFSGGEKIVINDNGNIGIGTTSPSFALDVAGVGRFSSGVRTTGANGFTDTDGTRTAGLYANFTGGNAGTGTTSNHDFVFYTNTTERMRITNGGNIGIGTTSPGAKLSVNIDNFPSDGGIIARFTGGTTSPTTERFVEIFQSYTGAAFDSPMLVFRSNTDASNNSSYGIIRGTANGSLVFSNVNNTSAGVSAATERMRITSAGMIGIGNTADGTGYGLELARTSSTPRIDLVDNSVYTAQLKSNGGVATLQNSSNNPLIFGTNNTERMRITSEGNVGIGTTSVTSGYRVEIVGDLLLSTASGNRSVVLTTNNANAALNTIAGTGLELATDGSNRNLAFRTGTTTAMYINSSANIGIGTTSPTYRLHLVGSTDIINATSTTTNARINIGHSGNGGFVGYANIGAGDAANTFYVTNGSGVIGSGITMNNAGNVGIGTTTPITRLHIVGGSGDQIILDNTGQAFSQQYWRINGINVGAIWGSTSEFSMYTYGAQPILFHTNTSERMRITSGGNVLVGTTTNLLASNRRLQVSGVCAVSALSTGAGGETVFEAWQGHPAGDNVFVTFYTDTSPNYRGGIDFNRAATQVRYNTTSDANLKNIIGDSDKQKSIDILNSTKIREYSWKNDETNKPQIGVIAQELYKTYKGAVSKGSDDELFGTKDYKTWGVDKTAFTFHLIAGWQRHEQLIQEQQIQIQELKAEIDELKSK